MNNTAPVTNDIKQLVLARLSVLPENIDIAVGSEGSYSKEQILQHVNDVDEVGQQFIDMQLSFLRALKEGTLFEQ